MVLGQRIVILAWRPEIFPAGHDVGAAQGFGGVGETHQPRVIRRDADPQRTLMLGHGRVFIFREPDHPRQFFQSADASAHLPAPVIPFGGTGAGPETAIKGPQRLADWKAQLGLGVLHTKLGDGRAYVPERGNMLIFAEGSRGRPDCAAASHLQSHFTVSCRARSAILTVPSGGAPVARPSSDGTTEAIFNQ